MPTGFRTFTDGVLNQVLPFGPKCPGVRVYATEPVVRPVSPPLDPFPTDFGRCGHLLLSGGRVEGSKLTHEPGSDDRPRLVDDPSSIVEGTLTLSIWVYIC